MWPELGAGVGVSALLPRPLKTCLKAVLRRGRLSTASADEFRTWSGKEGLGQDTVISASKQEGTHPIQLWVYHCSKYAPFLLTGTRSLLCISMEARKPCGQPLSPACPTMLRLQITILMQILASVQIPLIRLLAHQYRAGLRTLGMGV